MTRLPEEFEEQRAEVGFAHDCSSYEVLYQKTAVDSARRKIAPRREPPQA
jgi:hypothetical protein